MAGVVQWRKGGNGVDPFPPILAQTQHQRNQPQSSDTRDCCEEKHPRRADNHKAARGRDLNGVLLAGRERRPALQPYSLDRTELTPL